MTEQQIDSLLTTRNGLLLMLLLLLLLLLLLGDRATALAGWFLIGCFYLFIRLCHLVSNWRFHFLLCHLKERERQRERLSLGSGL